MKFSDLEARLLNFAVVQPFEWQVALCVCLLFAMQWVRIMTGTVIILAFAYLLRGLL